jgi:hypothetical protein
MEFNSAFKGLRKSSKQLTPNEDTSSNRASARDKAFLTSTLWKGHSAYNKTEEG